MRKIIFSILLATSAATPALAAPHHNDDRDSAREERQSSRAEARHERRSERRQVREERTARPERGNGVAVSPQAREFNGARPVAIQRQQVEVQRRENVNERGRPTLGRIERMENSREQLARQRRQSAESVAELRAQQREELAQRRVEQRSDRGSWDRRRQVPPVGARPDRPAPLPQTAMHRDRRDGRHEWRTNWRNDRRYDWRDHRRNHRSLFHVGVYFDPFGWGYQRYNVGWRLWPSYYSSNYWLNDPYMYRLPYAPWPYKWVRYYDDALLVDTMSGQVVDAIYGFFW